MGNLFASGLKVLEQQLGNRTQAYETQREKSMAWLESHLGPLRRILSSRLVRDFVFEPFRGLFDFEGDPTDVEVRRTITSVALMNAAMAAVPGSIGYGLVVAIALESYMAFRIARLLRFDVSSPRELANTIGAAAVTALGAGMVFKEIFAVVWRALALLPGPGTVTTFAAEYITTTALGAIFWVTFAAIKRAGGSLDDGATVSARLRSEAAAAWSTTAGIVSHQWRLLFGVLRPRTIRTVAERVASFLRGDVAVDEARLRGEIFVPVAMTWLLAKETERLDGPMGELFLDAVRRGVATLAEATPEEMSDYMRALDGKQLQGMMNHLKGEVFEAMVERAENLDGDDTFAKLHEDRSVPASDITLVDGSGTRMMEVSLKATDDPGYIGASLARYPDVPIMTTDEVAALVADNEMVMPSGILHAEVVDVTTENYEELLWQLPSHEATIGGGLTLAAFVSLYPFAVAWRKGAIDKEQFLRALSRVTGSTTNALASRLAFSVALGPVFGWYLMARGVGLLTQGAERLASEGEERSVERYVWVPGGTKEGASGPTGAAQGRPLGAA